ncbi:J domain-containing protein [Aphelenchoides bicaudatus]|nr:J domain-containing protein [Aphelenchoides bicaudatus]
MLDLSLRFLNVHHLCAPITQVQCISFSTPFRRKTHYETLGVSKTASLKEIKQAYYTKSKLCHPDNQSSADSKEFLELKTAYDVLRRPADRRIYDNVLAGVYTQRSRHRPNYQGQDWNRFWDNYNFHRPFRERDRAFQEAELRSWRNIFWFTFAGFLIITFYNYTFWYKATRAERNAANLIEKDEIAKCFLRQKEFKDQLGDNLQIDYFARLLRQDIEEAQRLKDEERRTLGIRNPLEIREEERWMNAVKAPYNADRRQK